MPDFCSFSVATASCYGTRSSSSLEQVIRLGLQIWSALEACHRNGTVHRDLKPGNIMLTESGMKLLDFGLARALEADRQLESESVGVTRSRSGSRSALVWRQPDAELFIPIARCIIQMEVIYSLHDNVRIPG